MTDSAAMFDRTRKEIQIHTRIPPSPAVAEVDRQQIEQVLLNIYVNAWQAMPDCGELFLEITTLCFRLLCIQKMFRMMNAERILEDASLDAQTRNTISRRSMLLRSVACQQHRWQGRKHVAAETIGNPRQREMTQG